MILRGLNETFYSWQGEGMYQGRRALFIRFAGCNMKNLTGKYCSFCDTPYAFDFKNAKQCNLEDLYTAVKKDFNGTLLVFTGGEPLVHHQAISDLIITFQDEYVIQIETNGSIAFEFKYENYAWKKENPIVYTVSPKYPPVVPEVYPLKIFDNMYQTPSYVNMKFVIGNHNEAVQVQYIDYYMNQYSIKPHDIWLMPEGTEKSVIDANMATVINIAKTRGFNVTTRMQIEYNFK